MKANYHTHCVFCDGADTPAQLAEAACRQGFDLLGFSSHSYTWFDESYCLSRSGTERYRQAIAELAREYQGRLRILCGVEQDADSDQTVAGYDYVIGSVHYVRKAGRFIPVDASREQQLSAVAEYWHGDYLAFAEDYFAAVRRLAALPRLDIVGHLDLVAKFNGDGSLFDEASPRYLAAAEGAVQALLPTGALFELSSGAMARGLRQEPYPARSLRRLIAAAGGRFVLSSDCHQRRLLDYAFTPLTELARAEGLTIACL